MPIAKDGWPYVAGLALAALAAWFLSPAAALGLAILCAFTLFFFRDPERDIPQGARLVVSPADGRVMQAESVEGGNEGTARVSIFLSIFNVHVNRSPIAGRIEAIQYHPGVFRAAFDARASTDNEQNVVTVRGESQQVVFKQIAGLIARRIVFWKKLAEPVNRGERVGLIKFGSRVDVVLPAGSRLLVKVGDQVRAGTSVLAELPGIEGA